MDSKYKLVLVDDSPSIRSILRGIIKDASFIRIAGEAENGKVAIDLVRLLQPDVILLDIEMPEMDGISALPHILKFSPNSQVIMVSTLTEKNASISLKAMQLGAADYLQKPSSEYDREVFKAELLGKIQALAEVARKKRNSANVANEETYEARQIIQPSVEKTANSFEANFKPAAIAIASSTGGPNALQVLFDGLKGSIPNLPIFITQHMPPVFTKYLAGSLASTNGIKCKEAEDGEEALPGNIYIAPGDFHMLAKSDGVKVRIKLDKGAHENFCRPAADPMLRSLIDIYGNRLLLVVLTGMGHDGLEGAKTLVAKGGMVIAQDKDSSVVWGMPGAVCEAGITSGVYSLAKIPQRIVELCNMRVV